MWTEPTTQIAWDLDCNHEAVLNFTHTIQGVSDYIAEYSNGSAILCTDDYTVYNDIEGVEGWTTFRPSPVPARP